MLIEILKMFKASNKDNMYLVQFSNFILISFTWLGDNKDISLREKCPNTELFLVLIFCIRTSTSPYSVRIQENTNQK